ncbi:MAG: glycoside hydrolase [Planctomycetaceae bacterium]|jgi:hypothetical protein|nr:glycoside hydrolase [Planctomycetaceae bacterium]
MKHSLLLLTVFALTVFVSETPAQITDFEVIKVYDSASHSAFTDLVRFGDAFYITFRASTAGHVPGKKTGEGDGTIPVLTSKDGKSWQKVAELTKTAFDLRDPKLSITPDGRIMVLMGGSVYVDGKLLDRQPQVSFSDKDGRNFSEPQPLIIAPAIKNELGWLWRTAWHNGIGYGAGYGVAAAQTGGKQTEPDEPAWIFSLTKTIDGVHYGLLKRFELPNKPNEAAVRFLKNGDMRIFLRCESGNGLLGSAAAPYTDWKWDDLGIRIGGPELIVLPNDKLLFGHRLYETSGASTVLSVQGKDGKLRVIAKFPSKGDTSYPGFVIYENKLYASYYSSHEGKTSIYLAIVPLDKIVAETEKPLM